MTKLQTLKDLIDSCEMSKIIIKGKSKSMEESKNLAFDNKIQILKELKQEAIKLFKNLQGPETIYPIILDKFPDTSKGAIAVDQWDDTRFRFGAEYGMLAMLYWLMNLTEEDVK